MASTPLGAYLETARNRLDRSEIVTLVMGNESADLDSMASALAYAYLVLEQMEDAAGTALAIMNIPRADFKLRAEAVRLFGDVGIDERDLVFTDDIDVDRVVKRAAIRLVLVDHNELAPRQKGFAPLIDEIIDHHTDVGLYPQIRARSIEPVGSTATLVTERIHAALPSLLDAQLAMLLLGTILLDTANLDVKRTHEKDKAAVKILQPFAQMKAFDLFERLESEKFNPGPLTTRDLLRKDSKESQAGDLRYAISSVPISTVAWIARDSAIRDEFRSYAAARRIDALVTMQFFKAPEFTRELGVYSADPGLRHRLVAALQAAAMQLEPLARVPSNPATKDAVEFFTQRNTQLARKNIQGFLDRLQ